MEPRHHTTWVGRVARLVGRALSTGVRVFVGVLGATGGKDGAPILPPTERPPVTRAEYRP